MKNYIPLLAILLVGTIFFSGCVFQANQTGIYGGLESEGEEGTQTNIWCGDGTCNGAETPQTCSLDCKAEYKELTPAEAKELIDSTTDILVLDVRSGDAFNTSHISNAVNIYVGNLSASLDQILNYKNKPVVVYCTTETASINAAQILVDNGFSNVNRIKGGFPAWEEAGYSTTAE